MRISLTVLKHVVLLAALLLGMIFLGRDRVRSSPYHYDEADYMSAASLGFWANYTDTPSLSLFEFLRLGLARGTDRSEQTSLSEYIRAQGDVSFYRHWHGPLYYYWLMLSSPQESEYEVRMLSRLIPVLTLLVTYFGSLWVLPGPQGQLAAVLSSALVGWSHATLYTTELAPHLLYVTLYLAGLLLLAQVMATGKRTYWYAAVIVAAMAFCTLEVAFVLLFTLLACGYLERRRLAFDRRLAVRSSVLFLLTALVLWPAGILKGTVLKAYLFMAYLALFRKSPWGEISFLETWRIRFSSAPVEWILLAVSVIVYFRLRSLPGRRLALPFLLYGTAMLLTVLRVNAPGPRYVLPFMPAFLLFIAFTLSSLIASRRELLRYAMVAVICALVFGDSQRYLNARPLQPNPRPAALLAAIREHRLQDRKLLVPQEDVPVIHYYFPKTQLQGYIDESDIATELTGRNFDAVLRPGYPPEIQTTGF